MTTAFKPTATIENLQRRADVIQQIRSFFEERDFFHVETPILSHDIVVDRYLHPISVNKSLVVPNHAAGDKLWLQTSPEFAMKRIVAAGAKAIYQITRAFRSSERGRMHNPEFTMLEWYRTGDSMHDAMNLLGELAETILDKQKTEFATYRAVFEKWVGLDPYTSSLDDFANKATRQGIEIETSQRQPDRDGWLNLLLAQIVEPNLGRNTPTIIYDWPASQSALAIVREEDPPVAERFELYVDGIELANGYHELLDGEELRRRSENNNRLRATDGIEPLPVESKLLNAMKAGLPDCCGVALGVDRLVMLALGAKSIDEVIAFPIEHA